MNRRPIVWLNQPPENPASRRGSDQESPAMKLEDARLLVPAERSEVT